MGFSGGTYTRTDGTFTGADVFAQQKAAGINITATRLDTEAQDMANALSTCILKDGTQTITANIPLNNFKITGLGTGTGAADAAAVAQIQNNAVTYGGTSSGAANVYAISVSPALAAYANGQRFAFYSHQANTSAATLNVNGLGAVNIRRKHGTVVLAHNDIIANQIVYVEYDSNNGGNFLLLNEYSPVIYRTSATVAVTNTVTETDLVSFTVPGNLLGTSRGVRVFAFGDMDNTSGAGVTYRFRVKYGGTNVLVSQVNSVPTSGTSNYSWNVNATLMNHYVTNSQRCFGHIIYCVAGTIGGNADTDQYRNFGGGNAAIDSTTDQALKVTIEMGTASASATTTLFQAFVEAI